MNPVQETMKTLKKFGRIRSGREIAETTENKILPQRVFLYLHPKSITHSADDLFPHRSEIEVEHQFNTITTLGDHYTTRNVIQLDQFDLVKPTFSVTIVQDGLENITWLADCPILLTLFVYTKRTVESGELAKENIAEEENYKEMRTAVAQGHMDVIEYFNNKRMQGNDTVFLYPLKSHDRRFTCKTEWEIYSLHPLLKNITFSNYLFLTFDSLYNINQKLMDDCQNLKANLSFISKIGNEKNDFDKIFICDFKIFSKNVITQQSLTKSWETLKSYKYENVNSMGITSECKIIINQLFSNLLSTENVEFNFNSINKTQDLALICNSMHRYVLTDNMQRILEDILAKNLYQIIIEICSTQDEGNVLLQGYIDLSIFMYPKVNNCSFAIDLKPPGDKSKDQNAKKRTLKNGKTKRKSIKFPNQPTNEDKIAFAIVQICLTAPITDPCQDMNSIHHPKPKLSKFCQYPTILPKTFQLNLRSNCDYNYRAFDDLILEIMDYIVKNNIKTLNDDKEFFYNQLSNINNKIMKLVACDFNIKTHTKTNIDFTNLITNAYRDLICRIYDYINKCSYKGLQDCVFTDTMAQNSIVRNMSLAKCLYEVGNTEMADIFMNLLRAEYSNNAMLNFYIFLYDIERHNYELVKEYLSYSLDNKDTEGELFVGLIEIYINYKMQLQDSERNHTAEEDLIKTLSDYIESQNPTPLTGFILLYCVFKRHNYQPGMMYCRWRYENLFDSIFIKLEFIPKTRWEIYMPYKINLKSRKGQNFIKVCYNLLRLGLYAFAQWVFAEIANECTEIEGYFFSSTFMILDNKLQDNFQLKKFSFDKFENAVELGPTLSLVNGNLEHFQLPNSTDYVKHYQELMTLEELQTDSYQLGLLRYGYKMMEKKKFQEASQIFVKLCDNKSISMVAAIEEGKACYYLGQLDEAEKYFALSTEYGVYVENVWGYLALINLKKGKNYNALECWKYARLNQNTEIHKDILWELNQIKHCNVNLFVDVPN